LAKLSTKRPFGVRRELSNAATRTLDHFEARSHFVALLAKQLHEAGTTAARLENALDTVGRKLKLEIAVWSSPTAIILSLSDNAHPASAEGIQQKNVVRVLRLSPGEVDLRRLCTVDDIAERVIKGELDADTGARALILAGAPVRPMRANIETILGFMLANIGVSCLIQSSWAEIAVAGTVGMILGVMHLWLGSQRRFVGGLDALCAVIASFMVVAASHWIAPMDFKKTVLACLIVLVPGLSMTSAAAEIATQHLVSGTARMAGAFATLLKLSFGSFVGAEIARLLGFVAMTGSIDMAPEWVPWAGLLISAVSFAVLFKALPRDFPLAMGAAILGYSCTRWGGTAYGAEFGVFFAGLVVTLCANFYARWSRRPGAIIRLPGIILLVPGSVGFKSLFLVFQKDVFLGIDTAVSLLLLVVSLVAGLLFASTLLAPRNSL
jgi:uncharacterized membrane protein YjjP (DUF1212 family)